MNYEKIFELRRIVASRIEEEVEKEGFELSISSFVMVHEILFKNILPNYGHLRKYNLEKPEAILLEDSVRYPDYNLVPTLLRMAIQEEKQVNYRNLDIISTVSHIVKFTSVLWQIHPFIEGNTRTTCVFIEKYLKSLGFNVHNDYFKENAAYFRDALVKANYENEELNIKKDTYPLTKFFTKLLIDNSIILDNNDLLISELYNNDVFNKKRILNK